MLIIGYFITRALPIFLISYIETETVVREVFVDKIQAKGILLKDEFVYTSDSSGLELSVQEGDRVRKGEALAKNTSQESINQNIAEISALERKIADYRTAYIEYDGIIEGTVEKSISNYMGDLKELFTQEERDQIKVDLENGERSCDGLFEKKILEIESQKEILNRGMQESMLAVFPGVISFNVDGVENLYDFDRFSDFSIEDYNEIEKKILASQDDQERSGLKLVENNLIRMAVKLDQAYEKDLRSRERLEVEFLDEELKVTARVRDMIVEEEELLLLLEITEGIHRIQNQRYPKIAIIKGVYDGLKVPTSALTESKGVRGVYIKSISGIVRFTPVRLLYKGRDYSIVNEDEKIEIELDEEESEWRTLRVFDEVFKNSILVREGQIVD